MLFRHGLGRTDFYILNDPELSFREIVQKNLLSAVSGSITAEMIEAAKLETSKSDAIKTETATKVEPIKSETIKPEEMKSENAKCDVIMETEVKLESSDKPQETKIEKVDDINDSTSSDKLSNKTSELINTEEPIRADKNQDENKVAENLEETNEKYEPMKIDNEESKTSEITDEKQEELSDKITEKLDDKSSEIVDEKTDGEKSETVSAENIQSDLQEKDKDESQIHEANNKTINNEESKTELSVCKEINENVINIPSGINNKPNTKVSEQIVKSKECSTSVGSVDRLRAMFPELEVVHKDLSTNSAIIDKLPIHKPLQQIDQTIAHLLATSYQNPIKWPKVNNID